MIIFKTIRWKNFLSTGNSYTEIDLNGSPSTLVVGSNGAGKSTMLDAICFVLFNKPFRKISKSQLINAVNEKDTVVMVDFSIGSTDWTVKRGIKPNVFEITRDGTVLNQESNQRDQQTWLEQSVLKLNYKSFTQVVILGSSTFVPFMQLTAPNRREVIEDLLDIKIFSTMNTLLKERAKGVKDSLSKHQYTLDLIKEKVDIQKRFIADIKQQTKSNQAVKRSDIESLETDILSLEQLIQSGSESVLSLEKEVDEFGDVDKKLSEFHLFEAKFEDKAERLNKELIFFDEHDHCPTCRQGIPDSLRSDKKGSISTQLQELATGTSQVKKEIESITGILDKKRDLLKQIRELHTQITTNNREIGWKRKSIKKIEQEISQQGTGNLKREQKNLKELAKEGLEAEETMSVVRKKKDNFDVASQLLRDTGIKSQIIKKYLPIMNKMINKYLNDLDFYVSFELDEGFEETIKSRFRDEFCYASFSEGEKMRIDLALLFTWRTIAKMKNSANTNLLILDEIFDSSLDIAGTYDFMKILRAFNDSTNVFIISHKPDVLQDKFERILRVEKKQNFSVTTEESGI